MLKRRGPTVPITASLLLEEHLACSKACALAVAEHTCLGVHTTLLPVDSECLQNCLGHSIPALGATLLALANAQDP
jgi:hypothetical protein